MSIPSSSGSALHGAGFAALGLCALILAWRSRPERVETEAIRLIENTLPASSEGDGAKPKLAYERWIHSGLLDRSSVNRAVLVPDPAALRSTITPAFPREVLPKDELELRVLGRARRGRPIALQVRVKNTLADDRIRLVAPEGQQLEGEIHGAVFTARFEVPAAVGPQKIEVLREGRRSGRLGRVRYRFLLQPIPAPRIHFDPSLSWLAKLAAVQGFRVVDDPMSCEVLAMPMDRPPAAEFLRSVDRGLGLLLLPGASERIHPGWLPAAPVLPDPQGLKQETDGTKSEGAPVAGRERAPKRADEAPSTPPSSPKGKARVDAPDPGDGAKSRKLPKARAVALALLVDDSGSMTQGLPRSRLELARRAAWMAATSLGPRNELAVISFGDRSELLLKMGSAARKTELKHALRGLSGRGSRTDVSPALARAWEELKNTRAPVRLVVIVTDGEFSDTFGPYLQTARAMAGRAEGITISGIGIGDENFRELDKLTRAGRGRFTVARKISELPRLLVGEVELATGARKLSSILDPNGKTAKAGEAEPKPDAHPRKGKERTAPEKSDLAPSVRKPARVAKPSYPVFTVQPGPPQLGLVGHDWKPVSAYMPLLSQWNARVELGVGEQGHALLATAPYGLGRVATLAIRPREALALASDAAFPQLFGQLCAWLERPPSRPRASPSRLVAKSVEIERGAGRERGVLREQARRLGARILEDEESFKPLVQQESSRRGTLCFESAALLLALFLLLALRRLFSRGPFSSGPFSSSSAST